MLFMLLILFHFSRQAGRQKRRIEKSPETRWAWIFYPCHVGRFCEALFAHGLLKIQDATLARVLACRNIPRGIRRREYPWLFLDRDFTIDHEQSSYRKTSLLVSLGIFQIFDKFNFSFTLIYLSILQLNNSLRGNVKFGSLLFSKFA